MHAGQEWLKVGQRAMSNLFTCQGFFDRITELDIEDAALENYLHIDVL